MRKKDMLLLGVLLGAVAGFIVYNMPLKYKARGSFHVTREVQLSEDGSFSYEGYYSQQVAISFTKTAIALIESPDIGSKSLEKLNTPVSEATLRKYKKKCGGHRSWTSALHFNCNRKNT